MKRYTERKVFWTWVFGAIAVLFNPLVPIRMSRSDWQAINMIVALFFAAWIVYSIVRMNRDTPG